MRKIQIHIVIVTFILVVIYVLHKMNVRYDELSSENGISTVCHVYSSYRVRTVTHHNYIYNVEGIFYSSSTSMIRVNSMGTEPIQSFLLIYDKNDPVHHTIIREYKFDSLIPLETSISGIDNLNLLIRKNTTGWHGTISNADKNDIEEIGEYQTKLKNRFN